MDRTDEVGWGTGSCAGCGGEHGETVAYRFDEWGELVDETVPGQTSSRPVLPGLVLPAPVLGALRPCAISTLNGSWLVRLTPTGPRSVFTLSEVRGPMRIEVGASALRVSGDVYVRRIRFPFPPVEIERPVPVPIPDPGPLARPVEGGGSVAGTVGSDGVPATPWYPQLPMNQYSWYFRSTGATYGSGTLSFSLERHLWDRTTQEFVSTDTGEMVLSCRRGLVRAVGVPVVMTGTARIAGQSYAVVATKTADSYRGCRIEVDAMTGRTWPVSATLCGGAVTSFQQVYAGAGWDVHVGVDELVVPDDASLTNAELQTLLATHRGAGTVDEWRLWLLVGSAQGGLFKIMFDDDTVPREGAVGFADVTLVSLAANSQHKL